MTPEQLMRRAIDLGVENVASGGGPFAALVVRDGEIVAEGANRVTANNDPTAHGEVMAIRAACEALDTFHLEGCELYTTCEPCPMCLGAIYWARLERVYFAAGQLDAAGAGFDDAFIYEQIPVEPEARSIPMMQVMPRESMEVFAAWHRKQDRRPY
ncbi:MAG: nucleoside deaminase [Rhodothermales bacterium]|nr:nucleoside deaminase [Rhodothermales bacterium]MBO6778629.1 nucleoside deaminase [Rhodothermales bacterium]